MDATIYLVGPRASGKTTLGQALAERLGRDFADTDTLFRQKLGCIAKFVAKHGWEIFRDEETRVLEAASRVPGRVVACGGGIVLRSRNREILAQGRVLYLLGEAEMLAERLARDPHEAQRPSLTGRPLTEEVAEVLAQRAELYEGVAHAVLDAALAPDALVEQALLSLSTR